MLRLITRRLLIAVPLVLFVTFGVFVLIDRTPGDPAVTLAGENPDPNRIEFIRGELNLSDPVPVRWGKWINDIAHGDLGRSLQTGKPVVGIVTDRLAVTLSLLAVAFVFAGTIAFVLGIASALRPRGVADRVITALCSTALAVPPFWIALLLVVTFAVNRHWLPAFGYDNLGDGLWQWFRHLVLPGLALCSFLAGELTLQLKGALTEVLGKDYILAAEAKGLSRSKVVFKHALKNAAVPVTTVAGLRLAGLVGGTATIESVFGLKGIGDLAVGATFNRDIAVMLGILLVSTLIVQLINLVIDISYGYFNPKVRT